MAQITDLIDPQSSITPGIAGSIIMGITNALNCSFNIPQKWCALALSLVFGLLMVGKSSIPKWQKPIYILINAMIIFVAALGINTVGMDQNSQPVKYPNGAFSAQEIRFSFMSDAYAQSTVSIPDGSVVKGSGPQVYLIKGGQRCEIPDPETFENMGFNWNRIQVIPDATLNMIPLGQAIPSKAKNNFFKPWK